MPTSRARRTLALASAAMDAQRALDQKMERYLELEEMLAEAAA